MFVVYAIASINRKYLYVGLSSNLTKRVERHNSGYEKTTKPYAPFILIYSEEAIDRVTARKREKYFKSRTGKRFLYQIIIKNHPTLSQYSVK